MHKSNLFLSILLTLTIATPSHSNELPANHLVWRGKVFDLNYLWGKGVAAKQMVKPPQVEEGRDVRDNKQRVNFENARGLVRLELLRSIK